VELIAKGRQRTRGLRAMLVTTFNLGRSGPILDPALTLSRSRDHSLTRKTGATPDKPGVAWSHLEREANRPVCG
jgi:hypothetical protein